MKDFTGTANPDGFETKTCGRCGGCGSYSFCQTHGSTCFGCGGSGKVFTARAKAAKAFLHDSRQRPVAEVKVGELIWDDTFGKKAKWLPITEIRPATGQPGYMHTVVYTKRGGLGVFPDSKVTSVRDEAERKATLAAALAFQETLGKSGKPLSAKALAQLQAEAA